jgi:predicted DNA-binding transcriptional regulator YafY
VDRHGRRAERRVEPHGLLVEPPVRYVLARDIDKAEARMFRMDRISHPRVLGQAGFRPDLRLIRAQFPDLGRWHPLDGTWATLD